MRYVMIIPVTILMSLNVFCAKDSKALEETRKYYSEMIDLVRKYSEEINESKDADSASKSILSFIDSRNRLLEKGKILSSKYPDIRNDPELVEYERSLEFAMSDFSGSLKTAISRYKNAKVFRNAVEALKNRKNEKSNN